MYKALLVVFAVMAVASAQYLASPYYGGYAAYRSAYPAYSAYSTGYTGYPYAYSNLGYSGLYGGASYLYR